MQLESKIFNAKAIIKSKHVNKRRSIVNIIFNGFTTKIMIRLMN